MEGFICKGDRGVKMEVRTENKIKFFKRRRSTSSDIEENN
jgi:hypothetical protein